MGPSLRQLLPAKQPDLAGAGVENARLREVRDAERLRRGQHFGFAVGAFVELVLFKPRQRPARVGVELALQLREDLVESLIDQRQGCAHSHRRAVGFEDLLVPRKDRHAWADGRLRQIDWGDVTFL